MQDKNGTPLRTDNKVLITGTVIEISTMEDYYNISIELDSFWPKAVPKRTIWLNALQTVFT